MGAKLTLEIGSDTKRTLKIGYNTGHKTNPEFLCFKEVMSNPEDACSLSPAHSMAMGRFTPVQKKEISRKIHSASFVCCCAGDLINAPSCWMCICRNKIYTSICILCHTVGI